MSRFRKRLDRADRRALARRTKRSAVRSTKQSAVRREGMVKDAQHRGWPRQGMMLRHSSWGMMLRHSAVLDDASNLWPPDGTTRTVIHLCVVAEATDDGRDGQRDPRERRGMPVEPSARRGDAGRDGGTAHQTKLKGLRSSIYLCAFLFQRSLRRGKRKVAGELEGAQPHPSMRQAGARCSCLSPSCLG